MNIKLEGNLLCNVYYKNNTMVFKCLKSYSEISYLNIFKNDRKIYCIKPQKLIDPKFDIHIKLYTLENDKFVSIFKENDKEKYEQTIETIKINEDDGIEVCNLLTEFHKTPYENFCYKVDKILCHLFKLMVRELTIFIIWLYIEFENPIDELPGTVDLLKQVTKCAVDKFLFTILCGQNYEGIVSIQDLKELIHLCLFYLKLPRFQTLLSKYVSKAEISEELVPLLYVPEYFLKEVDEKILDDVSNLIGLPRKIFNYFLQNKMEELAVEMKDVDYEQIIKYFCAYFLNLPDENVDIHSELMKLALSGCKFCLYSKSGYYEFLLKLIELIKKCSKKFDFDALTFILNFFTTLYSEIIDSFEEENIKCSNLICIFLIFENELIGKYSDIYFNFFIDSINIFKDKFKTKFFEKSEDFNLSKEIMLGIIKNFDSFVDLYANNVENQFEEAPYQAYLYLFEFFENASLTMRVISKVLVNSKRGFFENILMYFYNELFDENIQSLDEWKNLYDVIQNESARILEHSDIYTNNIVALFCVFQIEFEITDIANILKYVIKAIKSYISRVYNYQKKKGALLLNALLKRLMKHQGEKYLNIEDCYPISILYCKREILKLFDEEIVRDIAKKYDISDELLGFLLNGDNTKTEKLARELTQFYSKLLQLDTMPPTCVFKEQNEYYTFFLDNLPISSIEVLINCTALIVNSIFQFKIKFYFKTMQNPFYKQLIKKCFNNFKGNFTKDYIESAYSYFLCMVLWAPNDIDTYNEFDKSTKRLFKMWEKHEPNICEIIEEKYNEAIILLDESVDLTTLKQLYSKLHDLSEKSRPVCVCEFII